MVCSYNSASFCLLLAITRPQHTMVFSVLSMEGSIYDSYPIIFLHTILFLIKNDGKMAKDADCRHEKTNK